MFGRTHQFCGEIGFSHVPVEGEHGPLDPFVGQVLDILIDAAGGKRHDPIGPHGIELGFQVADLYDHDICLAGSQTQSCKVGFVVIGFALLCHDDVEAADLYDGLDLGVPVPGYDGFDGPDEMGRWRIAGVDCCSGVTIDMSAYAGGDRGFYQIGAGDRGVDQGGAIGRFADRGERTSIAELRP